jgi:glycosyltransferase involved in cell wall biosynthesis
MAAKADELISPPVCPGAADPLGTPGLVSVVTPAYNAGRYLEKCIESILNQTYPSLEIIVVDDGSTDNTRAILSPYISQGKIKYFHQCNQGPAAARNTAINHSSGEFIAFNDADDLWLPEKLEKQLAFLRDHEDVGMVYADAIFCGEEWERQKQISRKMRRYETQKSDRFLRGHIYKGLLEFNFIVSSSVVVRRSVLQRSGPFLENIRGHRLSYGEDFELWLRIARISQVDYIPQQLSMRSFHPGQLVHNKRNGYRQMCSLYWYLFFRDEYPEKFVIARKYVENLLKRGISWGLRR